MNPAFLPADAVLAQLDDFDAVIDARSPGEFALDHLPGARNWPSLNDEERVRVGTLYKQVSPFEAQKIGAALVAANISAHLQAHVLDLPKSWRPLIYCWRGGKRSGSLALVLGQIGFQVRLIEGGYKAFRAAVVKALPALAQRLRLVVLCGPTGSGKTALLHALAAQGAQVLDLEGLAEHRSSVLGLIPGQPQPSQKAFETRLWDTLRRLDPTRPVFVEAESRKVGNLSVPAELMEAMRQSACVKIDLATDARVALLMRDYPFFVDQPEMLCERLERLVDLRGRQTVAHWQALSRAGQTAEMVALLLAQHYDPGYESSTQRNFARYAQAPVLTLNGIGPEDMAQAAQALQDLSASVR